MALNNGRRPEVPAVVEARLPIYCIVMRKCWATAPALRPTFLDVEQHLQAATEGLVRSVSSSLSSMGQEARFSSFVAICKLTLFWCCRRMEDSVELLSRFGDRARRSSDVLQEPLLPHGSTTL